MCLLAGLLFSIPVFLTGEFDNTMAITTTVLNHTFVIYQNNA